MVTARIDLKHTIQEFEDKDSLGHLSSINYLFWRTNILPEWGDSRRKRALLDFYYDPYDWPIQGIASGIGKQLGSLPYIIKGDQPNNVRYFENVLSGAQFDEFGGGWRGFIIRCWIDFFRFDDGAYIEIIGAGKPDKPLKGRVTGLAHLNPLRCTPTGNPEFPVVYLSRRTNKIHRLHHTRVARLVDMPDGVDDITGRGLSALSRSISIAQSMILQIKYNLQRLDDLPPAGILALNNLGNWDDQQKLYEAARRRDGGNVWANTMVVQGLEPDKNPYIQHIPFASVPEHFDYRDYTEMMVNALALAVNVDPQEIWPLTGAALGTGTQSQILHRKGQGKTFADFLTAFTRMINFYVLPDALEFEVQYKDEEQDKQIAETDKLLVDTALAAKSVIGDELAAQYLANTSERFRDVLLDDDGQLRLPSDDPKAEEQEKPPTPDDIPDEEIAESDTPNANENEQTDQMIAESDTGKKAIQSTRLDFEGDFEDALSAANSGAMDRRRAGTVMRALVSKYSRLAFVDGLVKGGVNEPPDPEDNKVIASHVAKQSTFITSLLSTVSSDGISDEQIATKPAQWWVQSVQPMFMAGQGSADKNGMYEWVLGVAEHCDTCKRLAGQVHRMKDWIRRNFLPGSDKLDCHPGPCQCKLVKTSKRAQGRF